MQDIAGLHIASGVRQLVNPCQVACKRLLLAARFKIFVECGSISSHAVLPLVKVVPSRNVDMGRASGGEAVGIAGVSARHHTHLIAASDILAWFWWRVRRGCGLVWGLGRS